MASRTLTFHIFRHNPNDPESQPHLQKVRLDETPRMTLYTALTTIQEEIEPSLQVDFVCRSAICGSCAMLVNGRPALACRTRTAELPESITLFPLPFFRLVGDLSVDTGSWFRGMATRIRSWIHHDGDFDPRAEEERMSNDQAQLVYGLERCIECGCCMAACATAQMKEGYLGPAGIVRMARFLADPRDRRSSTEAFEVIGTDEGVFGCVGFLACEDYCPKSLPFSTQIAYLRRRMALTGLHRNGSDQRNGHAVNGASRS